MTAKRLIETPIPKIIKHFDYLIEFLKRDKEERDATPLFRNSPYYKWLAYSVIRRELFEEVRQWMDKRDDIDGLFVKRLYEDLIEIWYELKEYNLDGRIRDGIMYEVLYWLASLKEQRRSRDIFFIAPIHEGIPRLFPHNSERDEYLQFRGDFCLFWGIKDESCASVVDVKSEYGQALFDTRLIKTAEQYIKIGLNFFIASPKFQMNKSTIEDFDHIKTQQYLLDLRKTWSHRPLQLEPFTGPYPLEVIPPWLQL